MPGWSTAYAPHPAAEENWEEENANNLELKTWNVADMKENNPDQTLNHNLEQHIGAEILLHWPIYETVSKIVPRLYVLG